MASVLQNFYTTPVHHGDQINTTTLKEPLNGKEIIKEIEKVITEGLACEEYVTVLQILEMLKRFGLKPDLGARWHWLRIFNAKSGCAQQMRGTYERTAKNRMQWRLIDAMLRLAGPIDLSDPNSPSDEVLVVKPRWELQEASDPKVLPTQQYKWKSGNISPIQDSEYFTSKFRVVLEIPGPDRDRPNLSPARYWTCDNDTIMLAPGRMPTFHAHPRVPDLFCLKNVFSPAECTQILAAAKANGWDPDTPFDADGLKLQTIVHDFYWVIDDGFEAKLWNRIKDLVPAFYNGKKVRGLNRWFRIYEYLFDNEYPTHIDGAWPPSGIDRATGNYLPDASPPHTKRESQLTFLIYLSAGFAQGGDTAFFLPNASPGCFNVYPVKPMQGSALIFPHGENEQALWHESISVAAATSSDPKFVVRTELIYDA